MDLEPRPGPVGSLPALIVLKLTGVIGWSWWWVVLSPLWISGILLAPVLCVLLVLPGRYMCRRAASKVTEPQHAPVTP